MSDFDQILDSEVEHINNYVTGFESIITQYRNCGVIRFNGFENYTLAIHKANELTLSPSAGMENFITDAVKKLWEMIKSFFRGIKEFFFGKDKKVEETKDAVKEFENNMRKFEKELNEELKKVFGDSTKVEKGKEYYERCTKLYEVFKSKMDKADTIQAGIKELIELQKTVGDSFTVVEDYNKIVFAITEVKRQAAYDMRKVSTPELKDVFISGLMHAIVKLLEVFENKFMKIEKEINSSQTQDFISKLEGEGKANMTKYVNKFMSVSKTMNSFINDCMTYSNKITEECNKLMKMAGLNTGKK